MNEESKPLKALDTMYGIALEGVLPNERERLDECYNTLETIIEEYEQKEEMRFLLLGGRMCGKTAGIRAMAKLKAFDFIKENCEFDFLEEKTNDMPVRYEIHIRPKNKEQLLFNCLAIYPKTQEEFGLLKEELL